MADFLETIMNFLSPPAAAATLQPENPALEPPMPAFNGRFAGTLPGIGGNQSSPLPQGISIGQAPQPADSPLADQIKNLFLSGGQQQDRETSPQRPAMQQGPALPPRMPMQAAGPNELPWQREQSNGPQMTAASVEKFLRHVLTGAARANPESSKLSAFMQGGAGTLNSKYAESDRDKTLSMQERRLDAGDRRADLGLALNERREDRAENEFNRRTTRDKKVDDERQVRISERLDRIAKAKDDRLRPQDIGNFNRDLNSRAKLLQGEVRNGSMTPDQAERDLDEYRRNSIEQYLKRDPGAKATPKGTTGMGTQENPYTRLGATPQEAAEQFKSLKKGEFFLNPNDNKTYRRD